MRTTHVKHHYREGGRVSVEAHSRRIGNAPEKTKYEKPDWAKVSLNKFMFSDFDEDGVKNIDDPYPYNKEKRYFKQTARNSRFGGGEVLLSEELKNMRDENDKRKKLLDKFMRENKDAFGRIKTVPSTIKKLRERYHQELGDVAGVTILTENRKQANKVINVLKNEYLYDYKRTDNFYKNPKNGVYYAHHIQVLDKKNPTIGLEVQVKSRKMYNLGTEMHEAYKRGEDLSKYKEKAKKLYEQGY